MLRAKRGHIATFWGLFPDIQGEILALNVLYVPYSRVREGSSRPTSRARSPTCDARPRFADTPLWLWKTGCAVAKQKARSEVGRSLSHHTLQPCTLHPTPFTLHPTPFTPHPSPYTLTRVKADLENKIADLRREAQVRCRV